MPPEPARLRLRHREPHTPRSPSSPGHSFGLADQLGHVYGATPSACQTSETRISLVNLELRMLMFSVVLGLAQIIVASKPRVCSAVIDGRPVLETRRCPRCGVWPGAWIGHYATSWKTFPLFAAVVLAAHVSATHNALPRGVRGSTSGLASRTCPSMQPGYRCSVRSFGMS